MASTLTFRFTRIEAVITVTLRGSDSIALSHAINASLHPDRSVAVRTSLRSDRTCVAGKPSVLRHFWQQIMKGFNHVNI